MRVERREAQKRKDIERKLKQKTKDNKKVEGDEDESTKELKVSSVL